MEIANGESNPAGGQPLDNPQAETNFQPANDPDWTRSEWYRVWVELAQRPHCYPHE
jgi:hypothetical protein